MKSQVIFLTIGFLSLACLGFAQVATGTPSTSCTSLYGYNGDHDGDGIPNYKDQDFLTKYKPAWANRSSGSSQMGDGTRPQPRDGTGFGAQKMGRGKVYGQNATGSKGLQPAKQGQGQSQGRGNGLRKRDGSCMKSSSGSN